MIPNISKSDIMVRVLYHLQNQWGFTGAVIAGGAVRDLYFDNMISDIDIYVQDPKFSNENIPLGFDITRPNDIDVIANMFNVDINPRHYEYNRFVPPSFNHVERMYTEYEEPGTNGKISAVWNVFKGLRPFQLIVTKKPPKEHVEQHFDLGICMAHFDGRQIRYTPEFLRDVRQKQFSVVGRDMTQYEFDRALNYHIPKLKSRFPGYKTIIAPWNQHLVANSSKQQ